MSDGLKDTNLMMIIAPVSRVTQLVLSGLSYDINSIVTSYLGGKSRRKRTRRKK